MTTSYRVGTADEAQILEHLRACSAQFVPPLDSRVEIGAYARKLHAHAMCFEAWSGDTLVGLVAAYVNDPARVSAFLSSVSVLPAALGSGLASDLLRVCVRHCEEMRFSRIDLEVAAANERARRLYQRHGFIEQRDQAGTIGMMLPLGSHAMKPAIE